MKRRTAIRSILTLPAAVALPVPLPTQEASSAPAAANQLPDTPTAAADDCLELEVAPGNYYFRAGVSKQKSEF